MKHLILTPSQRNILLQAKTLVQDKLDKRSIDLNPIEMMDGNFCLPIKVIEDFTELKDKLLLFTVKDVFPIDIKSNNKPLI